MLSSPSYLVNSNQKINDKYHPFAWHCGMLERQMMKDSSRYGVDVGWRRTRMSRSRPQVGSKVPQFMYDGKGEGAALCFLFSSPLTERCWWSGWRDLGWVTITDGAGPPTRSARLPSAHPIAARLPAFPPTGKKSVGWRLGIFHLVETITTKGPIRMLYGVRVCARVSLYFTLRL